MMRPHGSTLLLVLAISAAPETYAQVDCPKALEWTDATYAQRTTKKDGHVVNAKTVAFRNASMAHLSVDGEISGAILIYSKNRTNSIALTFGRDKPTPDQFAEISMAVAPPMAHESWPRMMGPCFVPDGVSIDFDENDIPTFIKGDTRVIPKFKGTLLRTGLRISYSMTVEQGESWQGEASYSRELQDFDLYTDVQGWHVFRGNSFVESLPAGNPVSVRSVIERLVPREQIE